MSRDIALNNIRLQEASRWAHTEYSLAYHREYLSRRAGRSADDPDLVAAGYDSLDIDFIFCTDNGLIDWSRAGRVTDMGHAVYAADGSDRRESAVCPFHDEEEVWAFDAVAEYGLPGFPEQVAAFEEMTRQARQSFPGQLMTGGYYRTVVSGAIEAFGWDMLLTALSDPARMENVFDSFFRRTLFHMEAWAQTSAEVIIQHDDFVWTGGAFMRPEIYRQTIIPMYARLWEPLHAVGKKVLFCSDGDYTEFVADVAAAGADGFIFEPCVDFGMMASEFGASHCLVGSFADCRDLTFGKWDKVQNDVDRTLSALARCRGAILAVGNHLPANIPDEMLDRYFNYLLPRLGRP